jgi:hypothetical protein
MKDSKRKKKRVVKVRAEGHGSSRYARKKQYLRATAREGVQLWGFQVPHPKPWI